ncbi:MAG: hypothetical protein WEC59_04735 [Salibacteraceae bacterium]
MFLIKYITALIIATAISATVSAKVIHVEYYSNGNVKIEMIKLKKGIIQINQYYPDGRVFETGFSKNGLFQGQWTRYDKQGEVVATAFFKNNVKIGNWNHVTPYDQSVSKVSYRNGKAVSLKKYDTSGNLIASQERVP